MPTMSPRQLPAVADAASQAAEDAVKLGKQVSGEDETDLEGKVVAT